MVNLLPEEMKKGEKEDKGFEVPKEEKGKAENIAMTTPIKDESPQKQKKTRVSSSKPWGFIFKKRKKKEKNKLLKDTPPKDTLPKDAPFTPKDQGEKEEVKVEKTTKRREEGVSPGFGISLMPRHTMVISRVVRSRLLFLIVAIIIVSGLFFISRLYGNWHFNKLESQVEYLKREIVLLEAQSAPFLEDRDNIAALTNKAAKVQKVLNNHIYWTNFFNFLEVYTVPDVYFGDFSAQAEGSIKLMATSRNLMSLAQQIVVFNNAPDFIKEVNVSNIQKLEERVSAFFDLVLIEGIWQK